MAARPLASLSSALLARPGHAKPAMRPQGITAQPSDDLGWNDMGSAVPPIVPAAAAASAPAPAPLPPVLAERAELTRAVAPRPPRPAVPIVPSPASAAKRAAFTVRLDADRHLRLRLASAVAGRSSQQLVVAAIDAFIISQPQIETLARQIPEADLPGRPAAEEA